MMNISNTSKILTQESWNKQVLMDVSTSICGIDEENSRITAYNSPSICQCSLDVTGSVTESNINTNTSIAVTHESLSKQVLRKLTFIKFMFIGLHQRPSDGC